MKTDFPKAKLIFASLFVSFFSLLIFSCYKNNDITGKWNSSMLLKSEIYAEGDTPENASPQGIVYSRLMVSYEFFQDGKFTRTTVQNFEKAESFNQKLTPEDFKADYQRVFYKAKGTYSCYNKKIDIYISEIENEEGKTFPFEDVFIEGENQAAYVSFEQEGENIILDGVKFTPVK